MGEGIFARMIRFVGAMGLEAFPPFWYQNIKRWDGSIGIRIFVKKCSNFVQKTPIDFSDKEKSIGCRDERGEAASRAANAAPHHN